MRRLDPWTAAGLDRLRRGRFHEAAADLEQALARARPAGAWLKRRAADAWSCQGLQWAFAGDLGRARAAFQRALLWWPGDASARRSLARIDLRLGQPAEALAMLDPTRVSARGAEHHLLRAVCLDQLGEGPLARRALDDALAAALDDPIEPAEAPSPGPVRPSPADTARKSPLRLGFVGHADVHCRAAARVFERDPRAAAEHLEQALALNADYLRARVLLALADLRLGRPVRALEMLERARELGPRYPDVLCWLGLARLRAGDRGGASRVLEQAVTLVRGFGRGHQFLSLVRHAEGRTRAALVEARRGLARLHDLPGLPARLRVPGLESEGADEEDLVRGLAIRPGCADLHLALGRRRLDAGEPEGARAPLAQALALQPGLPTAMFELSRAELAVGSPQDAALLLTRLTASRPGWVDAQAMLGRARLRSGDAAGAVAPLRAALRQRPGLGSARSDLEWAILAVRRRDARVRARTAWWEGTRFTET